MHLQRIILWNIKNLNMKSYISIYSIILCRGSHIGADGGGFANGSSDSQSWMAMRGRDLDLDRDRERELRLRFLERPRCPVERPRRPDGDLRLDFLRCRCGRLL